MDFRRICEQVEVVQHHKTMKLFTFKKILVYIIILPLIIPTGFFMHPNRVEAGSIPFIKKDWDDEINIGKVILNAAGAVSDERWRS